MILFGTISLPALDETLTPIIQRTLPGRLISAAPKLLLNLALSYRGFHSPRLDAQ
jgi:hypothetical protein